MGRFMRTVWEPTATPLAYRVTLDRVATKARWVHTPGGACPINQSINQSISINTQNKRITKEHHFTGKLLQLADAAGSTGLVPYVNLFSTQDKVTLVEFTHPSGDKVRAERSCAPGVPQAGRRDGVRAAWVLAGPHRRKVVRANLQT